METLKQIAENLRASGVRADWCDQIAAAEQEIEDLKDQAENATGWEDGDE